MANLRNLISRKTPTSYAATGDVKPPKTDSELGSERPQLIQEVVPELASPQVAARTYHQMMTGDAAPDVSIRAAKTPVLGADFYMDPFNKDQINLDISEFVDFNLFSNLSNPWLIILQHVLRMFENGFSVLEPVYTVGTWSPKRSMANRKTYTLLKKLSPRPASTVREFEYDDNGGPNGLKQNAINSKNQVTEVDIPIEKLIIFTLNQEGGDLRGKSLLRTAYPHWYYKHYLYKIDAIQKERHGIGVPDIGLPPNATDKDRAAAHTLGRNLRVNEFAHIVRPYGFEVGFAKLEGNMVDVMKSIDHHNAMIMLNVMGQFMLLGVQAEGGGGRATGATMSDMFNKSLRYVANLICAYFNLYLIPKLVLYNFPSPQGFPTMKVRNIGETRDLQQFASALANLADKGLITLDLATEQWVRDVYDMPTKLEDRPVTVAPTNPANPADATTTPDAGVTGPGKNGNASTVGNNGGQGNMGADPNKG